MGTDRTPPQTEHPPKRTQFAIRNTAGTSAIEWFVVWAVSTILLTRAYLQLTGYPQIGSGDLHIAHALWGGALMMIALIVGWSYLGPAAHGVSIFLGGVGFGLFLDEVGKFVTKTNDYFYKPSAEIMFIIIVAILFYAALLRHVRKPTTVEALANASAIAAEGVTHGLTSEKREAANAYLEVATDAGTDPAVIDHVRGLLDEGWEHPDRLMAIRNWFKSLIPGFLRSPVLLVFCGWFLAAAGVAQVVSLYLQHQNDPVAHPDMPIILVVIAILTFVAAVVAMIFRNRTSQPWPLELLRAAALLFTMATAFVNFAQEGFGALAALAVGLLIFAIINYHAGLRESKYLNSQEIG